MNIRTLTLIGLFAIAAATTSRIEAGFVVAPNANASTPGDSDNRYPLFTTGGMRYQQVFAGSQFSSFAGPQEINEVDFRNGNFVHEAFTTTISDVQISLSTTSKAVDGLSATFADNVGGDSTVVYSGALTLSSTDTLQADGTHVFDIAIHFQNDFLYNPASGNLLLDVMNFSGADASIVNADYFDAVDSPTDPTSRVYGPEGIPGSTTGTADSLGLIAQFGYGSPSVVPEPSSFLMTGLGGFGLLIAARRHRKAVAA